MFAIPESSNRRNIAVKKNRLLRFDRYLAYTGRVWRILRARPPRQVQTSGLELARRLPVFKKPLNSKQLLANIRTVLVN